MISLYTTAFNLGSFVYSLDEAISNWLYYVDEVVIATIPKDYKELLKKIETLDSFCRNKIKIISEDIKIPEDIYWDGKIKNIALQNCSNNIVIQVDLDERLSGSKDGYIQVAQHLQSHDFACSAMLPTVNLYKDLDHFKDTGYKWYMHKKEGSFRGPVNFAVKEDGCFDPEKSDTCELVDSQGNLIPCICKTELTLNDPKIIHLGFLDLQKRADLNKGFWRDIWSERKSLSQQTHIEATDVVTNISDFEETAQKHNLPQPLWPNL
jgi:hypothetical protein